MKLLIVSATAGEIEPIISHNKKKVFDILITGVGMVATTYYITKLLSSQKFDLVLNLGIAGSFEKILLGEVVNVTEDIFSELGAEDNRNFICLDELNIKQGVLSPFKNKVVNKTKAFSSYFKDIKKVKGITVNKVLGKASSITMAKKLFNPQTESMEGAAFLYACSKENIPCYQIRSISNYVEQRNRALWKVEEAKENLCNYSLNIIHKIVHEK
jgi:futalosine hydrolase